MLTYLYKELNLVYYVFLYTIHADLISGSIMFYPTLLILGVSLILGNDLAGKKVGPDLPVMNE